MKKSFKITLTVILAVLVTYLFNKYILNKLLMSIVFIAVFTIGGILTNNMLSKEEIFDLVKENQNTIQNDINNNDFTNTLKIKGIEDVNIDEKIIEFSCGGAGAASQTSYSGFYYTTEDNMTAIWCAAEPLVQDGTGYSYHQENGDNYYYTEQICPNFYYYEAGF